MRAWIAEVLCINDLGVLYRIGVCQNTALLYLRSDANASPLDAHQNTRTPDPLDWVISSSNTMQKRSHSSPPQKASAPPPTPASLPDASSTLPHIYFGSLPSIA